MLDLAGKTAFVTGGASGIGLALSRAFAKAGMKVMLADIEADALAAVVESLHDFGRDVGGVICDVADSVSVERAAKASFEALLGFSPYSASKFAVVNMSEGLAMQLKPLGIGVTVLCPGYVRTRISESGRNRPKRYGQWQTPDPASPAGMLAAQSAELAQAGLHPSDVAAQILTAIHEDDLYVFTHPNKSGRTKLEERFAAILAAMDKAGARQAAAAPAIMHFSSRPCDNSGP